MLQQGLPGLGGLCGAHAWSGVAAVQLLLCKEAQPCCCCWAVLVPHRASWAAVSGEQPVPQGKCLMAQHVAGKAAEDGGIVGGRLPLAAASCRRCRCCLWVHGGVCCILSKQHLCEHRVTLLGSQAEHSVSHLAGVGGAWLQLALQQLRKAESR